MNRTLWRRLNWNKNIQGMWLSLAWIAKYPIFGLSLTTKKEMNLVSEIVNQDSDTFFFSNKLGLSLTVGL